MLFGEDAGALLGFTPRCFGCFSFAAAPVGLGSIHHRDGGRCGLAEKIRESGSAIVGGRRTLIEH